MDESEDMADAIFEQGDVVRLKSGGTTMTVNVSDERGVWCLWSSDGEIGEATFPNAMLVIVKDI